MILSGSQIQSSIRDGSIKIEPYNPKQINPNSYNLKLHNELLVYAEPVTNNTYTLDMKRDNPVSKIIIPPEGYTLQPGVLYLGRTVERTETHNFVPMLEGRSSVGRLGICIHVTAGFGDVGFCGYWTLELFCIQPVRIYPGVEICQIYYHDIKDVQQVYENGKYSNNTEIQPSKLWQDF